MRSRFGIVDFCSWREVADGILIREVSTGIVMEEIKQNGPRMVSEFKGVRINDINFLEICLTMAREYAGCKNTPIHVDMNPWDAPINQD